MLKKTLFIGLIGILAFSILFFPALVNAEQYYSHYAGCCFVPESDTASYVKYVPDSRLYHNDTTDKHYMCPVNFNVPDGSPCFIKSIGVRYLDNIGTGHILVVLERKNLYNGVFQAVASWSSGLLSANPSVLTASQGTYAGYKLVDTKKFAYWLQVYFYTDADVNPGVNLILHQIRIHYGT